MCPVAPTQKTRVDGVENGRAVLLIMVEPTTVSVTDVPDASLATNVVALTCVTLWSDFSIAAPPAMGALIDAGVTAPNHDAYAYMAPSSLDELTFQAKITMWFESKSPKAVGDTSWLVL